MLSPFEASYEGLALAIELSSAVSLTFMVSKPPPPPAEARNVEGLLVSLRHSIQEDASLAETTFAQFEAALYQLGEAPGIFIEVEKPTAYKWLLRAVLEERVLKRLRLAHKLTIS